jgi:hypothetical protein
MKNIYPQVVNALHMAIATIVTFLSPIAGVIMAVMSFVAFDTLVAYWRVRKVGGQWTSKKLRVGLVHKCITYLVLILLFYMTDKFILNDIFLSLTKVDFFITKLLSIIFIFIEFTSIDESYHIIKGKSIFKSLREMIGKFNQIKNDFRNVNEDKRDQGE